MVLSSAVSLEKRTISSSTCSSAFERVRLDLDSPSVGKTKRVFLFKLLVTLLLDMAADASTVLTILPSRSDPCNCKAAFVTSRLIVSQTRTLSSSDNFEHTTHRRPKRTSKNGAIRKIESAKSSDVDRFLTGISIGNPNCLNNPPNRSCIDFRSALHRPPVYFNVACSDSRSK